MVNRKGFIRIIEATIAILIIVTILIIVYRDSLPQQRTQDVNEIARDILRDISSKEALRNEILNAQTNTAMMVQTSLFINNSLPDSFSFELRACDVSSACGQSNYRGNVYSAERIISADTTKFDPIKIRLFIWEI